MEQGTKKGANIINAIQNLRMAQEQFDDFCRQFPNSKGEKVFKDYSKRISWMFKDLLTHPFLTEEVRVGIKKEIDSDIWSVPAILEKVALLTPEYRELIEEMLDGIIRGEEIKIIDERTNK